MRRFSGVQGIPRGFMRVPVGSRANAGGVRQVFYLFCGVYMIQRNSEGFWDISKRFSGFHGVSQGHNLRGSRRVSVGF